MNWRNFDFNSTKFIYFGLEDISNKLEQTLEQSRSLDLDLSETADSTKKIILESATAKSREILTGLNRTALKEDLAKQKEFFGDHADPKRIEEYFQKYLQQNSRENLSAEEWAKVMGDLAPEIKNVYVEASKERFSAEKINKDLTEDVFKNKHDLHVEIYENVEDKTPENILKFLKSNLNKLPENIREALQSGNKDLEEKIMSGSINSLIGKFERREQLKEKTEKEVAEMTENFAESVIGTDGWEKLDNEELLLKSYLPQYIEIKKQLSIMPEKVAEKFHMSLLRKYTPAFREQKGRIFQAQTEAKLNKSTETIDGVLEEITENENPAKLSEKEVNNLITGKLKNLDLFKNLPPEYRDILNKKLNEMWEKKVEKFIKNQEEAEQKSQEQKEEDVDKISRYKMQEKWGEWVNNLKNYDQDFQNSRDFQQAFIKKYFSNNQKDAAAYFAKHKNYAKSFEKSFGKYETSQKSYFENKIKAVSDKLSDSKVSKALKESFKKAKNNNERRGWLKYLDSHVGEYEKSIQNSAKLETSLQAGFKTLKNHPDIRKIREKFSFTQKSRKFLNGKGQYISPRGYEENLQKINQQFSALEKKDKLDREKAHKEIVNLSINDFDSKNNKIKNQTDFAKSGKIKMPEYLWQEFGKAAYKKKVNELYPQKLENKEAGLEKSPSVKFAKETIKNLSHEDLDFSRDFASQQSFNRQRHLRNQVSFDPQVWEIVKPDFQKKSEKLYAKHQELRKEMSTLSKGIKNLNPAKLDFAKTYKNLNEFSHQEPFFEFFKNQKVSNLAYDQVKNSEFTPKVLDLYGQYLKQKNGVDSSPETAKERKIIEDLSIKDLDVTQNFASFSEFKRQPYLQKTISFEADIWEKIQPNFEQKALQLYSEHLQIQEEQKKFEKALNSLTNEDLETDYESFSEFVHQPAMRQFFKEINISDMAYDALTDNFAGKMNELWENIKDSESETEFSDKDIQKLGTKHGLDFFKLNLDSRENLDMKFERLDKLLTRNTSLANFLRKQETHLAPVFLSLLGEMNNEDFKKLEEDLGSSAKSPDEIVNIFFNSPRRQYLLSEVRKNDSEAWRKLGIAERSFSGDLNIREMINPLAPLSGGSDVEQDEMELDEEGNPILETELVDDSLEGNLDSDESISEENETGELVDEEIILKDESEAEGNKEKSREILDEGVETEDEEDKLDSNEEIAESDEQNEIIEEELLEEETEKLEIEEEIDPDLDTDKEDEAEEDEKFAEFELDESGNPVLETEEDDSEEDEELDEEKSREILDEDVEAKDLSSSEKSSDDIEAEDLQPDGDQILPAPFIKGEQDNVETKDEEKLDSTEKITESDEQNDVVEEEVIEIEEIDADAEENEISRDSEEKSIEDDKGLELEKEEMEQKEQEDEIEKVKLEKEDIEKEELKSREKILENIQREELEESEQEKEERIENEQKELRRILRQDEFFQKLEKEGIDEIVEDGDEDSLRGNVRDDLLQKKSPPSFAEIHCSQTMSLESLLSKIHTYLELIAEKDIKFQMNLSEKEQKREVQNSREMFLRITDFLLQKEISFLQKVLFRGMNFADNKCSLRTNAQYLNDSVSKKFEFHLLERG